MKDIISSHIYSIFMSKYSKENRMFDKFSLAKFSFLKWFTYGSRRLFQHNEDDFRFQF